MLRRIHPEATTYRADGHLTGILFETALVAAWGAASVTSAELERITNRGRSGCEQGVLDRLVLE
jgi:hypothetical protein